jgi:hypothetical protein
LSDFNFSCAIFEFDIWKLMIMISIIIIRDDSVHLPKLYKVYLQE